MNSKQIHVVIPAHKKIQLTCKITSWSLQYKPLFSISCFCVYFADFMKYVGINCDHDLPVIGGVISGTSGQGA